MRIVLHGGPCDGEVVGIPTEYDGQHGVPLFYDRYIQNFEIVDEQPVPLPGGHWHRWLRMMGPVEEPYRYEYYGVVGPTGPARFWDQTA